MRARFSRLSPSARARARSPARCLPAGRAQKPGGDGKPRYFIDSSYCQPYDSPDRKWPGGDNGHSIGKRLGLGAGKYDDVWDTSKCYKPRK